MGDVIRFSELPYDVRRRVVQAAKERRFKRICEGKAGPQANKPKGPDNAA